MIKNKINLPPSDNIEIEYYVRDSEPDPDRQLYYFTSLPGSVKAPPSEGISVPPALTEAM